MLSAAFRKAVDMNIRATFQYRVSFYLSMIIFPLLLIVNIMLFKGIYDYTGAETIKGYTLTQMIWYFGSVPFVWVFIWTMTAYRVSNRIIRGDLTIDFLRPMSLFHFEFAHHLGQRLTAMGLEFVPPLLIYSAIYYPDFMTAASLGKFCITAAFACILMFLMSFLIGMAAFGLKNIRALEDLKGVLLGVFGGALIPIDFLPDTVRNIADALPFKYIFYEPLQFFLNNPAKAGWEPLMKTVMMQLLWIFVLYILIRALWSIAAKRFCAVGG